MKKAVVYAFAFVILGAISVNAQTTPQNQSPTTTQKQNPDTTETSTTTAPTTAAPAEEVKTPVTVEELPEAVKATLASASLKPWTPTGAFLIKATDGTEHFAINLKKDEQTGSVRLDKEGNPIK